MAAKSSRQACSQRRQASAHTRQCSCIRAWPLALVSTALAGRRAGLQQRPGDACVVLGLAAGDPDGGGADIRAVLAQPDALDQLGQVLLAQVVVGVGGAGLGAVVERVDGGSQHARIEVEVAWVGVQQLPGVAHGILLARRHGDSTRVLVDRVPVRHPVGLHDFLRATCNGGSSRLIGAGLGPRRASGLLIPASLHQPSPDSTPGDWLDSTLDLSCTNRPRRRDPPVPLR